MPQTRTRFGSLEFGVLVPDRADTWTRMVYAGPNKPIAPIDDPYQMFRSSTARSKDRELLVSVLDDVQDDLKKVSAVGQRRRPAAARGATTFVREMEQELQATAEPEPQHAGARSWSPASERRTTTCRRSARCRST